MRTPKNLLVKKERFFLQRLRGGRGRVLELGCGGGWRFFASIGPVVGLDLSASSLANAARVYDAVVLADAGALPFADQSFDVVVSLDFLGHVPPARKGAVLAEIRRVLKPGGVTLHYVEAAANDPLTRWARRQGEEFTQCIALPEGHIGLQPPGAIYQGFRSLGLEPLYETAVYKAWLYPERVVLYYDSPLGRRSGPLRLAVWLCRALIRWRLVRQVTNLLVTCLFEICDPVLPEGWAGGVLVAYSKPVPPPAESSAA